MKKAIFLLGLAMIIALCSCKKDGGSGSGSEKLTCRITSPQDGAEFSILEDIVVTVEAKSSTGTVLTVTVYLDDTLCVAVTAAPYTLTIPSELLTLGSRTIKAVAVDSNAEQAEATITVNIIGGSSGNESPDFVTFANGEIPESWKTNTWVVDISIGYDDHYSLRSNNSISAVLTYKTMNVAGYVEFFTRGGDFDLYIDEEKAQALSSVPAGSWTKWIYAFEKGRHSFRWEHTDGEVVFLDAVSFLASTSPEVTTNTSVTKITPTTAITGGTVTSDGNGITVRGVCWSTSENPTVSDEKTIDGFGTGDFVSNITGLAVNTLYYVRAYATNGAGTAYGEQVTFTTLLAYLPEVTTRNVTNITVSSADCGGTVKSDGNNRVTARGVCWATSPNPTVDDQKTVDGSGTGNFTSKLTDLSQNTLYYIRAYATNEVGTAYGEQMTFATERIMVVGEEYQGGIVAYVDNTGTHGFIVHKETKSYIWSGSFSVTGANESSIGSGKRNTEKIVNVHGSDAPGAYYCQNLTTEGYTDWFLPSFDELKILYQNRSILGGFHDGEYWSSSELNQINAVSLRFHDAMTVYSSKSGEKYIRAIRYF